MYLSFGFFSYYLFRIGIACVFLYFGYFAITEPVVQAHTWARKEYLDVIATFISISLFMQIVGILEIIVSLTLLTGKYTRFGLLLAIMFLTGTIVNLGFNDIAIRDFALLTGCVYLLTQA